MKINLIQDIATPHNNVLISEFIDKSNIRLNLWYALQSDTNLYQWSKDLTQEHTSANIYGTSLNLKFIKYCLFHSDERYIIVGWANINTILLTFLFFLLRRPFNHWTDLPDFHDEHIIGFRKRILRWGAYKVLKYSNSIIFGVGVSSIKYFRKLGFSEKRLINLPIFVKVNEDLIAYKSKRNQLIEKYALGDSTFIISAGSRIVREKGYDLLIKAISFLDNEILDNLKLFVVGSGPSLFELEKQVIDLNLNNQVIFIKWLPIEDFKEIIANSDIFVHPARIDSYGGTTLGMALGVPVIGSFEAGAALDRILSGKNGFLYHAEDIQTLSNYISILYKYPLLKKTMATAARDTALQWPPSRGVDIITLHAI